METKTSGLTNQEKNASKEQTGFSVPTISLPKGGGAIHGIGEKFAANPVTGTGSMTVPIATSPGRSGFGPQLSLSYDSGSGNGPFGFGWSLSIPSITRKTDKGLPQYFDAEESDVFILSGAEDLVPEFEKDAAGEFVIEDGRHKVVDKPRTVDGAIYNVRRYRPRIEGLFARIERWTRQSNGESHWRTITRDNTTTLYGKDNNSRIFDPADPDPAHPRRIFSWLICESYDDKGNHIVYKYKEEDTFGVDLAQAHEKNRTDSGRSANRYLKHIYYGNKVSRLAPPDPARAGWMFEVVFDYGEGHYAENQPDAQKRIFAQAQIEPSAATRWPVRPDPFSTYRAGFEVRTYRQCQRVLMFHHFAELGRDDYLVRSTDFMYDSNTTASFITSVMQSGYRLEGGQYLKKSLPPLEFSYSQVPTGEQLAGQPIQPIDAQSLENLPQGLDNAAYQWVDLDGEGLSGILTEQADAWFYKRNLGEGNFGPLERVAAKPSQAALNSGRQQLLDLAGDGQIDLVTFAGPTPGFYERTQDEGWENHRAFKRLPNIAWDDPNLRFVDLNGDGHADVLVTEGDVFSWYPSLAEDGFDQVEQVAQPRDEERGPRLVFSDGTQSIYLADMSGDGLTDLVRIRNGEVCYWPNLGYGRFGARISMDNAPWFDNPDQFNQRRMRLADIDGSGLTDILYLGIDGVRFYYNQSGNRWSAAQDLPQFPHIDNLSAVQVLDLLGNGTACLVWSSPLPGDARQPILYIDLMNGQKPHLLVETNNNLGAKTIVQYVPSTKFYLADRAAGKPWITKLPFPVHCVEKVTVIDKWRDTTFASTYSYHHGYFDGGEREFRGFGRVEQVDSEDYGKFASGNVDSPYITPDKTLYQPPVKTVTWYHTGAFFDREHILSAFADEYFPNWFEAENPGQTNILGLFRENDLPEPDLNADNLSAEEWREALRACKGMALRQEIYELDVDKLDAIDSQQVPVRLFSTAYHNCHIRRLQPQAENRHAVFLVVESEAITYNYELDLRQSTLKPDPRIAHTLNLRFDVYGRALQTVAAVYPRLVPYTDPTNALEPVQLALVHSVQSERHLAYTENHYTAELPADPDGHRLPAPCEVRTYELTGAHGTLGFAPSNGPYFTLADFKSFKLTDRPNDPGTKVVAKLDYHDQPSDDTAHKRIVEWMRTLYFKVDLSGAEPFGTFAWLGLPYETYKLALTSNLLGAVFGSKLTTEVLTKLDTPSNSGYIRGTVLDPNFTDQYWIRSGIAGFASDAPQHFYLPERYEDPFGKVTTLTFDRKFNVTSQTFERNYDLFVESSTDPMGNNVTVEDFDYRVLAPREMKDPNDNYSSVAFDVLGMPVASAIMGKRSNNLLTESGDNLVGFLTDLNPDEVIAFYMGAFDESRARSWLGNATARFVYSFGEKRVNGVLTYGDHPAFACGILREKHVDQLASGELNRIQTAFEYSDGMGTVLVKKAQAEPDPELVEAGVDAPLRWIASGKTVLNNKGKPVKQYEPYFSLTHRFDKTEAESEIGVTPVMYYDAAGRLMRIELPDDTFSRVEFSPWQMQTFDANDTVKDSRWYRERLTAAERKVLDPQTADADEESKALIASVQDKRAAAFAAQHANTPALTISDSLGRAVITLAHNRTPSDDPQWVNTPSLDRPWVDEYYLTFTKLDAEGKPLWICDSRGNLVMQYITPPKSNHTPLYDQPNPDWRPAYDMPSNAAPCYDIAGNLLFQHSMDAGDRWMLNDAAGKPMFAWDYNQTPDVAPTSTENRRYFTEYDKLHRPIKQWLTINTDPSQMVEYFKYVDVNDFSSLANIANARERNLCGQLYKHYDPSGLVQVDRIDFKGNPLEVQRQLVSDHTASITDWQTNNPDTVLETETYIQLTEYDALKRMTRHYNWHLLTTPEKRVAVYEPHYNKRGLLLREDLVVGAKRNSAASGKRYDEILGVAQRNKAIQEIRYDAKGQRQYLKLGSDTVTQYDYDPETFRLCQLRTTRPAVGLTFPQYHANLSDARVLQQLNYTYDPVGNITEIYDEAYKPAFFQNVLVEARSLYEYDALYRLTIASGRENGAAFGSPPQIEDPPLEVSFPVLDPNALRNYTQAYQYDAVGNIMHMRHVAGSNESWTRYYSYAPDSNRLLRTWEGDDDWNNNNAIKKTTYRYDTHGNMLNLANVSPGQFLRWDQRDMITGLDLGVGSDAFYQYDSGKQRTRKTLLRNGGSDVEERIYLGGFEIYRRTLNGVLKEEIETLHLFDGELRLLMVDQILETDRAALGKRNLYRYTLSNHLGSSTVELDEYADIISYEEYHPYGTTAYRAGLNAAEVKLKRYRYTGMERDEESGLSYHGARYYLSCVGRWLSSDPSGVKDGPNLYTYVAGNPIRSSDRYGLQANPETKPDSFASLPPFLQKQILSGQTRDDISGTFATARPQTTFKNINNPDENEEDVVSEVIMGDFYEGPATAEGMTSTVAIGIVPIVGQVADFRDILAGTLNVFANPKSPGAYLLLGVAAIGLIPGEGDATKAAFKTFLKERGIKYGSKELDNALKMFVKHDWKQGPLVLAFGETKVAVMEVVNKLKPDKLPMNYELLAKEVKLVQDELNAALSGETMRGLKSIVADALENRAAVKEVSEQVRKSLPPAAEGFAHRHLPDAIISGNALGIAGEVEKRVNSVFGPNSAKLAKQILELPDDVEHFLLNLVLKVK